MLREVSILRAADFPSVCGCVTTTRYRLIQQIYLTSILDYSYQNVLRLNAAAFSSERRIKLSYSSASVKGDVMFCPL